MLYISIDDKLRGQKLNKEFGTNLAGHYDCYQILT